MVNAVNWFDIPVSNMARATKFYGTVLDITLQAGPAMPGFEMAMFPNNDGVNGALVLGADYTPSQTGTLVYLNGGDDLNIPLGKVEAAGGKVILAKTDIGDNNGFFAYIEDTEGNKVGLHSMS
jgi:uncharacterized protein